MLRSGLVAYLKSSLWFVPVVCVIGGAALSFGTIAMDRALEYQAIPNELIGDPTAVTAILSTIAASMMGLTTLVLTITMVVVQLAMGQFSPRIVQRILRDKPSQVAIGLFVATFVHSILALREVTTNGDGTGKVPGIAVVTAFLLVILSIAVLVLYVHHIGRALRVSALIELVGRDTRKLVERLYPGETLRTASRDVGRVVPARESGVITAIGYERLVDEASRTGSILEMVPSLGEFVPAGAPLFRVRGGTAEVDEDRLCDALRLDDERTLDEDVAYGMRLLVDIAERSLADAGFQDPTTAVQAIDRLHDLLRQLVRRPFPDGIHRDAHGDPRLVVHEMTWDAYVHLAFDEIRMVGAASPQISRRLMAALSDLKTVAPPDRVEVLDVEIGLLKAGVKDGVVHPLDLRNAVDPDGPGIGQALKTEPARNSAHQASRTKISTGAAEE